MTSDDRAALELQLLAQLTGVKQEIAKLERQRETLEALLLRARQEMNLRDVTRKNSLDRILIENSILGSLRRARKPLPTKVLFYAARMISPQLRNATFRSYLHRLKSKAIIDNSVGHGFWTEIELDPDSSKASSLAIRPPGNPAER